MDDSTQAPLATGPLLDTKFYFPRWRPGLAPRTRLVARLDRGVASKLTLVSAPPGFGKTTLLAEWLAERLPPAHGPWRGSRSTRATTIPRPSGRT